MRAIFYPNIDTSWKHLAINGDKAKHLIKVVRVKLNEEILILSGDGKKLFGVIEEITKKELVISIKKYEVQESKNSIDLFVGQVKKEALDLVIKMAVELGVNKLIIGETQFSQRYVIKPERIENLIESAMEQSNNAYKLIVEFLNFKTLDLNSYESKICLSSTRQTKNCGNVIKGNTLLIIGPEGGFSEEEENFLEEKVTMKIHLPTPILRTPTAVACGVGIVYSSQL